MRGLIGATGSPTPGETVLVQVAARPVTGLRLHKANQAAAQLRDAHSVRSEVFDALTPGRRRATSWAALRPEVSGEVRAILSKSVRPRLETVVRYLVATPEERSRGGAHRRALCVRVKWDTKG